MKRKSKPNQAKKLTQTAIDAALATEWRCDQRTIRRWRRAKAPLEDPDRLRVWLSTQKHLPAGTRAKLEEDFRSGWIAPTADGLATGAAAALKRLETGEAAAYAMLESAIKTGDAHMIKASREHWLRVSESLRRYDLAVEQHRRADGELIPRTELESALRWLGRILFYVGQSHADQLGPRLALETEASKIAMILRDYSDQQQFRALGMWAARVADETPNIAWMAKAVAEHMRGLITDWDARFEAMKEGMRTAIARHAR